MGFPSGKRLGDPINRRGPGAGGYIFRHNPVGNTTRAQAGKLGATTQLILAGLNGEAVYITDNNGQCGAFIVSRGMKVFHVAPARGFQKAVPAVVRGLVAPWLRSGRVRRVKGSGLRYEAVIVRAEQTRYQQSDQDQIHAHGLEPAQQRKLFRAGMGVIIHEAASVDQEMENVLQPKEAGLLSRATI
jgi:hypothetical protein